MARTRKSIQPLNLYKYDVLIEDKATRSDYFKVTQFDGNFYGGRNAFLVAGTGVLRPNSKILVEVLNKDGTTIYSAPITSFIEGNSRLVQIEVYNDTPIGAGKIVLLGCADTYLDGTPVPTNWQGKYNVRWMADVIISPLIENKTPIRFEATPSIVATEKFYYTPSSSQFVEQIKVPVDIELTQKYYNVFPNGYLAKISGPGSTTYNSDYLGGVITGAIALSNGTVSTTSSINIPITKIYNGTLGESQGTLIYINNTLLSNAFLSSSGIYTTEIEPFGPVTVSSSINIQYNKLTTINTGSAVSFANLRLVDLKTISGEIHRIRLSYKAATEPGEFVSLGDINTTVAELLAVDSSSRIAQTGQFTDIKIDDYWYSETMSLQKNEVNPILPAYYISSSLSSSYLPIVQSSVTALDSITATPQIVNGRYINDASYFIGTKNTNTIQVFPRVEYTLAFDATVSNTSASVALNQTDYSLEVYLVAEAGYSTKLLDTNPRGQLLGILTPTSTFQRQNFEGTEFNFIPKIIATGNFGLRFIAYGGFWNIANVSVKAAQEPFFSPDEINILIPNANYTDSILTFRAQYLDVNNNSIGINTFSTPTYFTGSGTTLNSDTFISASFATTASFATSASWAPSAGSGVTSITVSNGLSGGVITTTGTISLNTGSVHFLDGVKKELNTEGVISSSQQINTGSFTGSFIGTHSGSTFGTASVAISASFATTASFAPTILPAGVVSSSGQVSYIGLSNIPSNIVSSSAQVIAFLPVGTVSSSRQINTGSFTGSFTGTLVGTSSWASNAVSSSFATSASWAPSAAGVVSSYTNATDNRVITSTGAGGINAEANLTFDGNIFAVNTNHLYVSASNVGINTTTPSASIDIAWSGTTGKPTILLGATDGGATRIDATQKNFRIGAAHYTNAQLPYAILMGNSSNTSNEVRIGGGTGLLNAATSILFYTTGSNTSPQTSYVWQIYGTGILESNGAQIIRTSTGNLTLATAGGNGNIILSPNGTGNVGIGTITPGANLHVQGNVSASSYTSSISNGIGYFGTSSFAVSASWAPSAGGGVTSIVAGSGLSGGTITSTGTISLDTSSVHFLDGVKKELNTEGVISSSVQISHNSTTGYVANEHINHTSVSITAGSGLSGGGTIAATRTLTLDTSSVHFLDGVKKELNTEGVISSSTQQVVSTYTNATDNRVLTSTGVGGINAESTLTYDGTVLSISTNNARYFQGGDDAALYDVNVINTLGVYGVQDSTVGAIKLGSSGQTLYSNATGLGIGTTSPSQTLHVVGNATITGSLILSSSAPTELRVIGNTELTGSLSITGSTYIRPIIEHVVGTSSAPPATLNYNVLDGAILFHSGSATANWTLNFRGNASTTLNSIMPVSSSTTVTLLTRTTTAYSSSAYQIDGTSITPRWQGGVSGSGNANSIDAHTFTIIKISSTPAYLLLGSITRYT